METMHTTELQPIQQAENDDQVIEMWLLVASSKSTRRCYRMDIVEFRSRVDRPLRRITVGMVQGYLEYLETRKLARASVMRKLAAVKSLFTFATKIGYLSLNPAAVVKLPHVQPGVRRRIPTPDEVAEFITDATEFRPWLGLLAKAIYLSGARVSEMLALRGGDIETRQNDAVLTLYGKGGKTRNVAVPLALGLELLERESGADRRVFTQGYSRVHTLWVQSAKLTGMPWLTPHALRHAHATHAMTAGCPMAVLRDTLGHSSLAITSRYVHATPTESSSKYLMRGVK